MSNIALIIVHETIPQNMILILGTVAYNFTSQGSLTNNDDGNETGKKKTKKTKQTTGLD